MRPAQTSRIVGALLLIAFTAWAFVMTIWVPLYGYRQTQEFAASQDAPAVDADIVREEGGKVRTWSIQDRDALTKLREGFRNADFSPAKAPQADRKFKVRIRRSDSKVDEYEVLLDERGSEHDMLYVVRRSGGAPIYGSAFKTPELRSALQQVLREPAR
jgi:hypothetical protein